MLSDAPGAKGAVPFDTAVDGPEGRTDLLCGKYRRDRSRAPPLLMALPDVVHLPRRLGHHHDLRAAVDLLANETTGARPGRDAAISGLLDLLLVSMVCAWFDDNPASGWPQALHDSEVAAALQVLPQRPGYALAAG